jgi:hypothetical protein
MAFHSNPLTHELCLPKVEVNKFDGSNPIGWFIQMEIFFFLHDITDDLIKIHIGILYFDSKCWKWWKWHKNSHRGYLSCTQFVAYIYERFETNTHHLGCLTKLKKICTVEEYITTF